ncbi:zinc finger protein 2-like [Mercenaria mercenaria]|uniref:zinc finger protein 2-like n=1 Tax=Mercenaria mercenaria TaxID=6596 RepID=UPI00234F97B8|nr:zinc finger protein 2-like [Mercenaria mercenaria]XP_045190347.2 zinc finger protein 2-like [Mercenaria mercenaria]
METYLMMLYVTLDQESALKTFFADQGWTFCKPDLSVTTDKLGPAIGNAPQLRKDSEVTPGITGKRKASSSPRKAPKIKLVKIVSNSTDVDKKSETVSERNKKIEEKDSSAKCVIDDTGLFDDETCDDEEITDMIVKMKERKRNARDVEAVDEIHEAADSDIEDVGDEENDDTDDSIEGLNDEEAEEKLDGTNEDVKSEIKGRNIGKAITKKGSSKKSDEEKDSDDNKAIDSQEDVIKKLLSQSRQPDGGFKCCICSKEIKVKYNMKRHLRTHLPDQINCSLCNRFFESFTEREEHMRNRHSSRHICETCGVSFKRKSDLNAHMIKHESVFDQETSPNCFKCTYKDCGKIFFRQTNFEYHLNVHNGVRPYECIGCLRSFHSKYTKNEHEKDCVNDVEYKCDICGSVFKQRSGLHNHKQAEHVRQEKGYPCEICSQMFKFSSGLIRHKKEKHQLLDASQQTDTTEVRTAVKVESEVGSDDERELVTPTGNTAYIVVADIEPENKAGGSASVTGTVAVETSVEEIPETSHAEIMATMSEQVLEGGGEINIERVIVVHQVASDMPQHLEDLNS